jgi:hydroxymethylpyrimidine pyrophosphatase-like HAD family hydrolase
MIENEILSEHPEAVIQFGKEAQISVFSENTSLFPEIRSQVEDFVRRRQGPDIEISMSHYYINISLKEVDKGRAIERLLKELGLARDQVAGVGDTEGDLPLRNAVGFFACPANSREGVKSVADYVSPYPDIKGMLDILHRPELRRRGR